MSRRAKQEIINDVRQVRDAALRQQTRINAWVEYLPPGDAEAIRHVQRIRDAYVGLTDYLNSRLEVRT